MRRSITSNIMSGKVGRFRSIIWQCALLSAVIAAMLVSAPAGANTVVVTPNGTWTAYPGSESLNHTTVQQPINTDGSSNFKYNGKSVIPVKFALATGVGPFVFESIFSDAETANDFSFLSWRSSTPLLFKDITELSAIYAFTDGDCAGGSLRWSVRLNDNGTNRNLDVHYQPGAGGISQQTCAAGTSGANLIQSADTIYVTQLFNGGYSFPSAYNNTYADALAQLGNLPVIGITLIVDSGWGANGNQVVDLTSATVGVQTDAVTYSETFVPGEAEPSTPTCPTDEAAIKVTRLSGSFSGAVNEAETIQPKDSDGLFRIVDCKYMYNLATGSLPGIGKYKVEVVIGGDTATGAAEFDLR